MGLQEFGFYDKELVNHVPEQRGDNPIFWVSIETICDSKFAVIV